MPIQEGGLYEVELTFTDREDDDATIDLSSSDLAMEWYGPSCSSPITLTEGSGIDVTDAADGVLIISLSPEQTCQLGQGEARCILYQDYNDPARKAWLLEGSESVEAKRFDA